MTWRLLTWSDPGTVHALHLPHVATPAGQLLFLVAASLLAWFAWWCYRREPAFLAAPRRRYLLTLRLLALAVVLFMATGAYLSADRAADGPPAVAMVVDRSASMRIADARQRDGDRAAVELLLPGATAAPTRDALARAALARPAVAQDLAGTHRLDWFGFGERDGLDQLRVDPTGAPALGEADQRASLLGQAVGDAMRRTQGRRFDAVVVVSDGGWNRGGDPVPAARLLAERTGVPLVALGVGVADPVDQAALWMLGEDTVFKGDRFRLDLGLRFTGMAGRSATLVVTRTAAGGGAAQTLWRETIAVTEDGERRHGVDLAADVAGTFTYAVELVADPAEGNLANNRLQRSGMRVIDRRLRVLAAERAPRWEYRYLKGFLEADRLRMDPRFHLVQGDPATDKRNVRLPATAADLRAYDAIVLGDLEKESLTAGQWELIESWVRNDGGGLLVVAGPTAMPGAHAGTALDRLLPVVPGRMQPRRPEDELVPVSPGERRDGFRPLLTTEGLARSWMRLETDASASAQAWTRITPIRWCHPIERLKPGATTLLEHPTARLGSGEGRLPILSWQRVGRGQVAFLASDETWRWRLEPGAAQHRRWWGQLVAALGMPRALGGAGSVIETDRLAYGAGDPVRLLVRGLDRQMQPLASAQVRVVAQGDGVRQGIALSAVEDQPGVFAADWTPPAVGSWRFELDEAAAASAEPRIVDVTDPRLESDDAGMNRVLLTRMADAGQGRFLPVERIDELPSVIREMVAQRGEVGRAHGRTNLWNAPGVMLLLVLLLGLEWYLRKRWDLA